MRINSWFKALLPLGMAMAMACSSGEQAQQPSTSGGQTTTQPTPTQASQQGPGFAGLIQAGKNASYKVTYKFSGTAGGQSMTGEQTIYTKPPTKMRMDMNIAAGGMSTFNLEDGTYMCTSQGGRPTCLKMGATQTAQQDMGVQARDQVQGSPDKYDTTSQGTRTIAGQQANCYGIKPKAGTQAEFTEGTFCYTGQGVPMLMQMKGSNLDYTMEATSYSATVADADFTLPAPITEIPSIPGGIPNIPGAGR